MEALSKVEKLLRIIFISVAIYPVSFCIYWSIQNNFKIIEEYNDCGRIRSRSSDEVVIKHPHRVATEIGIMLLTLHSIRRSS